MDECLSCCVGVCLLFYAIATVFQLYLRADMMCEMRWRKAEPTNWGDH